ncbi:uncharacterized protein ARMOST_12536 [Armillaria ostoyae]|uniref:Uncharacterized protein n=1 Tax=Armillaria ostoyae TaxID=47428 RepID=A0A284RK88_ARMOS|nr:uncharacterized protein ARMOST_12536 [Armillaria ostoyae]
MESSPPRPDPLKRRHSSAQPNLGGPSCKSTITKAPMLVERSEPEEELPARKVGRSKKASETAGASSRRVSHAEDSGWEDNNVFQSGTESSSPMHPSPPLPKWSLYHHRCLPWDQAVYNDHLPNPGLNPNYHPSYQQDRAYWYQGSLPPDELIEETIPDDHEGISEAVVTIDDGTDLEVNEETNASEDVPASAPKGRLHAGRSSTPWTSTAVDVAGENPSSTVKSVCEWVTDDVDARGGAGIAAERFGANEGGNGSDDAMDRSNETEMMF